MICHRPALRLRQEPAFARTVSVGAPHAPPTLLGLSPHFKTDAPSTHFIILVCGRAKSAARPVIHPNLYQEHMLSAVYARHPASVLVSYAGMVLKQAPAFAVLALGNASDDLRRTRSELTPCSSPPRV